MASTSDKLMEFRRRCQKHFEHRRKKAGEFNPEPQVDEFPPQYRRFAQAILDDERAKFQKSIA